MIEPRVSDERLADLIRTAVPNRENLGWCRDDALDTIFDLRDARRAHDEALAMVTVLREALVVIGNECYECPECNAYKPGLPGFVHESDCKLVAMLADTAAAAAAHDAGVRAKTLEEAARIADYNHDVSKARQHSLPAGSLRDEWDRYQHGAAMAAIIAADIREQVMTPHQSRRMRESDA